MPLAPVVVYYGRSEYFSGCKYALNYINYTVPCMHARSRRTPLENGKVYSGSTPFSRATVHTCFFLANNVRRSIIFLTLLDIRGSSIVLRVVVLWWWKGKPALLGKCFGESSCCGWNACYNEAPCCFRSTAHVSQLEWKAPFLSNKNSHSLGLKIQLNFVLVRAGALLCWCFFVNISAIYKYQGSYHPIGIYSCFKTTVFAFQYFNPYREKLGKWCF